MYYYGLINNRFYGDITSQQKGVRMWNLYRLIKNKNSLSKYLNSFSCN